MKQLSTYINEKLVLNKETFKKPVCNYFPKTKDELQEIIEQLLEERKDDDVIDLNDIDTSKITEMNNLFEEMNIKKIDISEWDVSNVKSFYNMFSECIRLESIGDLSGWNVSKVKTMEYMFNNCRNLKSVGDISRWNIQAVERMTSMFRNCEKLTFTGDLSAWNNGPKIISVYNLSNMFKGCNPKIIPDWWNKNKWQ